MTNPFLLFLILEEMEGRADSSFDQRPETLNHSSNLSLSDWSEAVLRVYDWSAIEYIVYH